MQHYYRIRPVHAPVKHARIESYPTYEAAMVRIEEIIYTVQLDHTADHLEYDVDLMSVSPHSTFIHKVATRTWSRDYE